MKGCAAATSRSGAFSLVEAMIAMVVLAVSVAAIAQAITAGHTQTHAALHELRAISLAEARMERTLAAGYANLAPSTAAPNNQRDGSTTDALYPAEYQAFSTSVTVTAPAPLAGAGLGSTASGKTVTVTVGDGARVWTIRRFVPQP